MKIITKTKEKNSEDYPHEGCALSIYTVKIPIHRKMTHQEY